LRDEPDRANTCACASRTTVVTGLESGHKTRGYLLVVLAAACWAFGGLTAKWLFTGTTPPSPSSLSAARAVVAFVLLVSGLGIRRLVTGVSVLKIVVRDLPFLVLFGVVGLALVHFTYFAAIEQTNVPTAILLEYLASVIVLAVSVLFLGEKFTWALPVGVALAVTGCALMVGAIGGSTLSVSPAGIAWGLASAVCFAAYTLMGKYAAGRYSPWTLLTYGLGFASLFWILVLGPAPIVRVVTGESTALAVLAMAVVATIVPFGAYLKALSYIDATKASITATLEPVIAGVATYVIPGLGEPLGSLQLLGGALVLAAILVVQMPAIQWPSRRAIPPVP
jgi:drug/metabolite transporter, DME family